MRTNDTIHIKILCFRTPVCYAVWRVVQHVIDYLSPLFPEVEFRVTLIKDSSQIAQYTRNLVLPSLVIDEKLICSGQIPSQQEILGWLQLALAGKGHQPAVIRSR